MKKLIGSSVSVAVLFILLGAIVLPNFANTQDNLVTDYEDVDTSIQWNDAIVDSQSSNFSVNGGTLTLTGDTGVIQTQTVETDTHDRFILEANQTQGDVKYSIYNASDDTVVKTSTLSGDTDVSVQVTDYNVDSYYVQLEATTTTDGLVESYMTYGEDDIDPNVSILVYVILVLFLVGLAMGIYSKHT